MRTFLLLLPMLLGCRKYVYETILDCHVETVALVSRDDGSAGVSVVSAEVMVEGTWTGTTTYPCSSGLDDTGPSYAEMLPACGDELPEETISVVVEAMPATYPLEAGAPTAASDAGCGGRVVIPVRASASVPSGSFVSPSSEVNMAVWGADGVAEYAQAVLVVAVADDSGLAEPGATLELEVMLQPTTGEAWISLFGSTSQDAFVRIPTLTKLDSTE